MAAVPEDKSGTGPQANDLPSTAASNRFTGRVAIVTGGASGIGLATVKRLASEGATVYIFDINKSAGEKESGELQSQSLNVHFQPVDVSDKSACLEGSKKVAEDNNGALHYLVNCAANFGAKGLSAEKSDWDKSLGINVVGYSNMVQACYGQMNKIPDKKSIVNICSTCAHGALPVHWTYNASKGAILTMTKCMALDLAKDNIRVNSISPGWVWTPQLFEELSEFGDGRREKWEPISGQYHMLDRFCESSEVASAICFLLSDDASYITGSDLPVDGGYLAMGPEGHGEQSVFAGSQY